MVKGKKRMIKKLFLCSLAIITFLWVKDSMAFELTSVFENGEKIPYLYTCDGKDISPPLSWKDLPVGTKSVVLVMDDPDAPTGTWDHWIVYNIPTTVHTLEENVQTLPQGALLGRNSWSRSSYGGPCPPRGEEHRYFFKLYAIDTILPLNSGMTKQEIEEAIRGHVITATELVGKYQR
jgi:Raf kinase inhibitor-like YbhB/YbcL family protein